MNVICAKNSFAVLLFQQQEGSDMRNLAFAPIIVLYLWAMGSYAQQSNPGLRNGDEVRPEISVLPLSGSTVTDLHLRPRFTTTIRLPEPVTSVAVGAPTIFEVEHSDQEPRLVFVKPSTKDAATSNLIIALESVDADTDGRREAIPCTSVRSCAPDVSRATAGPH
jgi:hypothetical protein